ncbi:SDR family NAD(P)-dependent oxidoreductase, partial [Paraburkholderia sp. SIMBA_054]
MNLNDKVAIVTGAASGLGLATCKTLHAAGAKVVGFDLDGAKVAEVLGPDMTGLAVDVADERSVMAAVQRVRDVHGAVH